MIFKRIKDGAAGLFSLKDERMPDNTPKWIYWSGRISYCLLCIFFFGLCFTGGGHYIEIGPLTPRLILAALVGVTAVPSFFYGKKLKDPIFISLLALLVWIVICAVRGWFSETTMRFVLMSDIKGFMWFALVPVCLAVVNSRKRFSGLLNWVLAGAMVQACLSFGINIYCVMHPNTGLFYGLDATMVGNVAKVSDSLFRIFFDSGPYLVVALAIVVFRQAQAPKLKLRYVVMSCLYLNALLISYTRSLYGAAGFAAVVSVVLAVILHRKNLKPLLKYLGVTVVAFLLFVCVEEILLCGSYFNLAIARTFNVELKVSYTEQLGRELRYSLSESTNPENAGNLTMAEEIAAELEEEAFLRDSFMELSNRNSDNIRKQTKEELAELISQNPIFGNGLGTYAPCRDNGYDMGLTEYFYLDTISRMGIVGLCLYFAPMLCAVVQLLQYIRRNKEKEDASVSEAVGVIGGLSGFLFASAFNPWMNAVLGLAWYSVTTAIPGILKSEE